MEVFLAIVAEGSLAGAATRLAMSPPAVTRALGRLEERLRTTLFVRTTRSLALTAAGEAYIPRARDVLEAMASADATVTEGEALRGTLTLTAPRHLGRIVIAPIVADFLAAHPGVNARLVLDDRITHLLEEGIDLGVRIGRLEDTSSIARRLGEVRQCLVASPAYLAEHGTPESPADLSAHRLIAFTGRLKQGRLAVQGGTVPFEPFLIQVDCAATALELAECARGLTPLWSYQCADAIREGRLVPVLFADMPEPAPCQFIWPERRFANALVRAFADFAAPFVKARLDAATKAVSTASACSAQTER